MSKMDFGGIGCVFCIKVWVGFRILNSVICGTVTAEHVVYTAGYGHKPQLS